MVATSDPWNDVWNEYDQRLSAAAEPAAPKPSYLVHECVSRTEIETEALAKGSAIRPMLALAVALIALLLNFQVQPDRPQDYLGASEPLEFASALASVPVIGMGAPAAAATAPEGVGDSPAHDTTTFGVFLPVPSPAWAGREEKLVNGLQIKPEACLAVGIMGREPGSDAGCAGAAERPTSSARATPRPNGKTARDLSTERGWTVQRPLRQSQA